MSWQCSNCGNTYAIDPKPGQPVSCICQQATNVLEVPIVPRWVKWLRHMRATEDSGVGDTIERLLGKWGKRFKATMQRFGIDCGCGARQEYYNRLYPYE